MDMSTILLKFKEVTMITVDYDMFIKVKYMFCRYPSSHDMCAYITVMVVLILYKCFVVCEK